MSTVDQFLGILVDLPAMIITFLIVILLFYAIARAAAFGAEKALMTVDKFARAPDLAVQRLIKRTSFWAVMLLGVVAALSAVGVNLVGLMVGLGLVGFALGFALKDPLANFLSGVLLLVYRPLTIGDNVVIRGFSGTVEDVNIRSTTLRTSDGRMVISPNNNVLLSDIVNESAYTTRRVTTNISIQSPGEITRALDTGLATIKNIGGYLDEPKPQALVKEITADGVLLEFQFWVNKTTISPQWPHQRRSRKLKTHTNKVT